MASVSDLLKDADDLLRFQGKSKLGRRIAKFKYKLTQAIGLLKK